MKDMDKTKEQLVDELIDLRRRIVELEASEERLKILFEYAPDGCYLNDLKGTFVDGNRAAEVITGYKRGELIGQNFLKLKLLSPTQVLKAAALLAKNVLGQPTGPDELVLNRKDGGQVSVEIRTFPVKIKDQTLVLGIVRDITERKRVEDLIRTQRDLGLLLSTVTGLDEGIRLCVEAAIKVSKMDCAGFYLVDETSGDLNMIFHKGLPPDFVKSASHYDADSDSTRLVMAGKPLYAQHHKLGVPLNEVRSHERLRAIAIVPVRHEDRVIGCLNIASHTLDEVPLFARDALEVIAAQIGSSIAGLEATEALRESEKRYRELVDLLPQTVFETDLKGNFTFVSRHWFETSGYTQEDFDRGFNALQGIAPEDRDRARENMQRILNGEHLDSAEYTGINQDGSITHPMIMYANAIIRDNKPVGLRGIAIDIAEYKRMEAELLKAQKLESIGILAGGIAHDFNNILTGILGNISLARMYKEPDKIFERLAKAEKASFRARDLTQQLLTFSKGGMPIKKISSIATLLRDSTAFALSGSNVRCQFSLPDDLWSVEIDEGQINQVINNLIINADQAMPEGGNIEVRAENVTVGAKDALPLEDGEYVKLSIQDQGIGISKEHLQRIFDPYFTTKQKGSGLGLATSYSIISNHGGHITAESQVGIGTTFHIYLPVSPEKILIEKKKDDGKPVTGEGRILVVDDEELVRQFLHDMLTNIGYEVIAVADGVEAVNRYKEARESDHSFDAVIIDLTIPGGMGGKEAIRELMKIDPGVRAIVSSGYSNDPIMANFKEYGFKDVIAKPYKTRELSEVLHEVIAGAQG